MQAIAVTPTRWGIRILTAIPVLFLIFSGAIKLAHHAEVSRSMTHLGMPEVLAPAIGILELACVVLYLIPRTAVVGAVLATGFLGGAVALHLRVGDPLPTHTLFPIYVGALLWAGLFLRDARVRALVAHNR
jgi:uncharacterized membrane protein YphA (DoxX/SURF4 family)